MPPRASTDQPMAKSNNALCKFSTVGEEKKLQMCGCERCLLIGKGAFGRVYIGKFKDNPNEDKSMDVAVINFYMDLMKSNTKLILYK